MNTLGKVHVRELSKICFLVFNLRVHIVDKGYMKIRHEKQTKLKNIDEKPVKMPGEVIRKELCYKEEILININLLFKVFCRIFEECIWCVHYGISTSYKYRKTMENVVDEI